MAIGWSANVLFHLAGTKKPALGGPVNWIRCYEIEDLQCLQTSAAFFTRSEQEGQFF